MGWNGATRVAAMGRASLNLFQLITASNEELTVKGFEYLEKSTPPQGGEFTALQRALDELKREIVHSRIRNKERSLNSHRKVARTRI